ncbi:MAG: type IV pilus biogenesis protein EbsA [Cyanobium sp.]
MTLAQMAADASACCNPAFASAALMADGFPADLISPVSVVPESVAPGSVAPLVPLFAPYCGGLGHDLSLEDALSILLEGSWTGRRLLQGGRSHLLRLSWSGETAPQEELHCDLIFPDLPQVSYRFDLPCHQLVQWLMERDGEELPTGFWRWLLLGQSPLATESVGSAA